jgi:hypothetical protein
MAAVFFHDSLVLALEGQIGIRDPSTVILCDGNTTSNEKNTAGLCLPHL